MLNISSLYTSYLVSKHLKCLTLSNFIIKIYFSWKSLFRFFDSGLLYHHLWNLLFLKYSKYLKRGNSFHAKLQATLLILDISKPFESNFWGIFRVWEGNNGMNLILQYHPWISYKCHAAVIKLFHKFKVRLWK